MFYTRYGYFLQDFSIFATHFLIIFIIQIKPVVMALVVRKCWIYGVVAVFAIALLSVSVVAYRVLSPGFRLSEDTYIYIRSEDTIETLCGQLEEHSPRRSLVAFRMLAALSGYETHLWSGRYLWKKDDSVYELFRRLYRGEQTPVRLVVPSVRTIEQLASSLSRQTMLDSAAVVHALTDSASCARLGYTPQTIACLILPNTYEIYWNLGLDSFLERMQREHARYWNEDRLKQAEAVGLSPNEVVTLASIVDEETAMNDEKPIIAGVYINRLRRGMLLQADPTVKYANGDFTLRRITYDLLDMDSPYNTYKYPGLPPGPIRIPSISGIESVLHYQHHNYLYMCAREDFSGYHNFAVTLAQHLRNAANYQRELNRRNIY